MQSKRDVKFTKFLIILILTVSVCILLIVRANTLPVGIQKIRRVEEKIGAGITGEEILKTFGKPTSRSAAHSQVLPGKGYRHTECWRYTRFLKWGYIDVYFNTNGLVEFIHYERGPD